MANIAISGDTSGAVTLFAPAVSGTTTLTLPTTNGTIVTTGTPASGNIIQVVNATFFSQTSTTGSTYVASTVSATITPKFATSKIFMVATYYIRSSVAGVSISQSFYRNGSSMESATYGINYWYMGNSGFETTTTSTWYDSPASTSAQTYTLYFKRTDSAGTVFVGNTNNTNSIQLWEIAA
jgi:hypothetical protein